ncbi:hypothetical protein P3342_011003 [Pyrenophora teres f. teres]|nr:hypothetical protein P3342_011003 [Pyrenophora teres f. teres]
MLKGPFSADGDASPDFGPAHDDQMLSSEEEELGLDYSDHEAGDGTELNHGATAAADASADEDGNGMLPRDKQRRTAFYDYTAEKQMSHTEAKQFYQRHQLETHGGSQAGEVYSPAMRAKTFPVSMGATDGVDFLSTAESVRSRKSNVSHANQGHRSNLPIGLSHTEQSQEPRRHMTQHGANAAGTYDDGDTFLQADQKARSHAQHPALPHEDKPLLAEEGIHGAGAGIGVGTGAGGFAMSDSSITAELSSIYTNIQKVLDLRHKYIRLSLQRSFDNPKDDPAWRIYPSPPEPVWNDLSKERRNAGSSSMQNSGVWSHLSRSNHLERWVPTLAKTFTWKNVCQYRVQERCRFVSTIAVYIKCMRRLNLPSSIRLLCLFPHYVNFTSISTQSLTFPRMDPAKALLSVGCSIWKESSIFTTC